MASESIQRKKLDAAAARWGSDLDLVQGQGGNLSLKEGAFIDVKGSGARLSDALRRDIFVRCSLAACRKAYRERDEAGIRASKVDGGVELNPSIETSLHAALPGRVVFHFHCVNAIASTASVDMDARREGVLAFGAVEVPYVKPGVDLAHAIVSRGERHRAFILKNHGAVLQADSIEDLETLLTEYRKVIAIAPSFDIWNGPRRLESAGDGWSRYLDDDMAAFGRLVASLPALRRETLYPDHAVVLGPGIPRSRLDGARWLIGDDGAVAVEDAARAALEPMIEALIRVVARIAVDRPRSALSPEDVRALLNWDAEKERQSLLHSRSEVKDH